MALRMILIALILPALSSAQRKCSVYFPTDQYEIQEASKGTMDSLSHWLHDKTGYLITIQGHTDNTGAEAHNNQLSKQRAGAVRDYLKTLNVQTHSVQGYGASQPVADNATEVGKMRNRRVDILIELPEQAKITDPSGEVKPGTTPTTKVTVGTELNAAAMEVGSIIRLKNMNFEGGTAQMLPESVPTLKELLKILTENPTMEVEVEGFVCCADDMPLSIERAVAVCNYLYKNGIDKKRLSYKGNSNYFPISSEETEAGRKLNRRVEIKVLKK